jgi:hypothetical protein
MKSKLLLWSVIGATVWGLLYFRGDVQRYAKMKMM